MAKFQITGPDGSRFEITAPDGSSEQDVLSYAQSQFGKAPSAPPSAPEPPGLAAAAAGGLGRGTAVLLGLPGDIGGHASWVTDKAGSALGVSPETVEAFKDQARSNFRMNPLLRPFTGPGSSEVQQQIEGVTGELPKPQTTAEKYVSSVMEFVPGAVVTPGFGLVRGAYSAVRDTITKQAPEYGGVMKGYERASKEISEIEKTLSLNPKASVDTSLRKLQSVMRNNVNTNYGKRADLTEALAENGAPQLMEKLAGQASNAWTPRGLNKLGATGAVGAAWFNPSILAALPAMSPRIVGEAAHAAGRAAGSPERLARQLLDLGEKQHPIRDGAAAALARALLRGALAGTAVSQRESDRDKVLQALTRNQGDF